MDFALEQAPCRLLRPGATTASVGVQDHDGGSSRRLPHSQNHLSFFCGDNVACGGSVSASAGLPVGHMWWCWGDDSEMKVKAIC